MSHVFISYVRENWVTVSRIAAELRAAGIDVWLDRNDINPGERWQDAIRHAIRSGAFFVACFSKEFRARPESYMNEELAIAIDQLRKMPNDRAWFIPVVLDDETEVPHLRISAVEDLSALQHVRLGGASWDDGVLRILKVMQANPITTMLQSSRTSEAAVKPVGSQAITDSAIALVPPPEPGTMRLPVPPATNEPARIRRNHVLAACVLILATIGGAALTLHPLAAEQSFVSQPGERRRVVLSDGSVVTLRGDTVLRTHFSTQLRIVTLERGEALFVVSRDPKEPFRVVAGSASIGVIGTEFDVRLQSGCVQVAVMEGVVEVIPQTFAARGIGIGRDAVRVIHGKEVTYGSDGHASPVQASDPNRILGWTQGNLFYKRAPLREIIEDLQHDLALRIRLDPAVSGLTYTGTVRPELVHQWIKDLPMILPVEVIYSQPNLVLIRSRT